MHFSKATYTWEKIKLRSRGSRDLHKDPKLVPSAISPPVNISNASYWPKQSLRVTHASNVLLCIVLFLFSHTEWATFALGPGHGIQLKSGRLLAPAYAYHIDCKKCFRKMCKTTPHSFCFYSDTHGRMWHFGKTVPDPACVECQVVSVDEEDGTNVLYCNARSTLGSRIQALSFDNGATFQRGQLVHKLVEPRYGCHGSLIGFPAPFHLLQKSKLNEVQWVMSTAASPFQTFLTPTWVVYGHPTHTNDRQDLGLYLNVRPRDPDSWTGPWVIYNGPSAYSDLTYVELASTGEPPVPVFACLFENGTRTAYEEISFCIFTLFELINNLPQVLPRLCVKSTEKKKRRRKCVRKFCRVC